ncbi:MAG: tRNA (adenosine(37)-N6)-threonylcarbamoyltransferase complex transferase subunit TsaD [Candidatus Shikimatogenerans bostrichidophilus]|nr:MAG: tRNA (adenosine(37)-N6)-threonylcarbamoyltransferase complex transferase subunit TsaD [Candidatus Shikimatogenerans bostrichidophilus]
MNIKDILKYNKIVLGIETSFNDTSSSILKGNKILSNIIYEQNHNKFNGVKPNIAYDLHLKNIYNVVKKSIDESNISKNEIDAISFTKGPGLIGSLMIGEIFSKSLALSLNIPIIGVNHIHAHLLSIYIYNRFKRYPDFPYICLSISGGHTKLFIVKNFFKILEIGTTLDQPLGILYDKTAILLGYKYKNGASIIEKKSKLGNYTYRLPIPKVNGLNFSFSGLMTKIKNIILYNKEYNKNNICRSLQVTVCKILKDKINKAINKYNIRNIVITGGVSSNKFIKENIKINSLKNKYKLFYNYNKNLLKDNAAMIALVGQIKLHYKLYDNYYINSKSILNIENL